MADERSEDPAPPPAQHSAELQAVGAALEGVVRVDGAKFKRCQEIAQLERAWQVAQSELTALKQGLRQDQQRLAQAQAQRDAAAAAARAAEEELAFYTAHVLGVEKVSSEKMAAELAGLRQRLAARRGEVAAARAQMVGRRALQDG